MSVRVARETVSLSGFGGGYEDMCQRMLWRGVAYLSEVNPPLSIWEHVSSYEGVYRVLHTKGDGIKALEETIIHAGDDVTGAMHQCVMSHLCFIHHHGVDTWLDQYRIPEHADRLMTWAGEL